MSEFPDLPGHGRYPFRAIKHRTPYEWPNGARLAVYVGLNVEHFAFGEGSGAELVPGQPQPDVLNYAWRDYGNRVGVWRLIDLFDRLCLPASVIVNSAIYSHCPEVMAAFRERGDEIVAHGRTNAERQGSLDEGAERALIAEAARAIAAAEGVSPRGWLGPWISQSHATLDLLAEEGFRYCLDWCMDDQPTWLKTRGDGRILSVPYPQELNDIPAIVERKNSAEQFADMIVDNFDEMLEQAAEAPLVMGVALHPYVVGQPYRLKHLRRALQHVAAKRGDIWFTTAGAIADHVMTLPDDRVP